MNRKRVVSNPLIDIMFTAVVVSLLITSSMAQGKDVLLRFTPSFIKEGILRPIGNAVSKDT